mgnify:CR=1 FL=1
MKGKRGTKTHRHERNPQEKIFHDKFIVNNQQSCYVDTLVFGHRESSMMPNDYLTDREKMIVLNAIQWLGSPVGEHFLDQCGYVPKPKEDA